MLTTHADIIQALAREDAVSNDEAPLADVAVTTWRRDCLTEAKATVWIHGESVQPGNVIEAIDALGPARAAEIYAETWGQIAERRKAARSAWDISQEIDTLRRLFMEASAARRGGILARIDRLTDDLHRTPTRGR